ncbi:hypothetical protein ACWF95_39885 [Streptomyces vinaceus]
MSESLRAALSVNRVAPAVLAVVAVAAMASSLVGGEAPRGDQPTLSSPALAPASWGRVQPIVLKPKPKPWRSAYTMTTPSQIPTVEVQVDGKLERYNGSYVGNRIKNIESNLETGSPSIAHYNGHVYDNSVQRAGSDVLPAAYPGGGTWSYTTYDAYPADQRDGRGTNRLIRGEAKNSAGQSLDVEWFYTDDHYANMKIVDVSA